MARGATSSARLGSIALAVALCVAFGAAPAGAEPVVTDGEAGLSTKPPGSDDPTAVEDFWTAERIAAAPPIAAAGGDVEGEPDSAMPLSTAGGVGPPVPFAGGPRGTILGNVASYPNRVHGKLVGTLEGIGTFACSGTVVSSGSLSLIVTAGHCAFDPQAGFARNLAFAPAYSGAGTPYGVWPITNVIVPSGWARRSSLDYDVAMMRVARNAEGVGLQELVGSRGIAFGQSRGQKLKAYGYPVTGSPRFNGARLVRCSSGYVKDPARNGGPRSLGIRCDMKKGASGGGWVAQNTFLVSETSHGYPEFSDKKIFGPYFGRAVRNLYTAKQKGWPSIRPVRCHGQVATIVGTDERDRIRGTEGNDVIASLGGDDHVVGGKGKDLICAGEGDDVIFGNAERDRLDGGPGQDVCNGGAGRNRFRKCEVRRG